MNLHDYYRFNLIFIIIFSLIIIAAVVYYNINDSIECQVKTVTGVACNSCGLTRDFVSFLKLDFENTVNKNSLKVFILLMSQLIYRSLIAVNLLKWTKDKVKNVFLIDLIFSIASLLAIVLLFW
jgi:hypothetical protein